MRRRSGCLPGCLLRIAIVGVVAAGALWFVRGGSEPASIFGPQPSRRFIWIGTTDGKQFTDEQYEQLANNFHIVVLSKFHAGFDIALHQEAARHLHELNPSVDVYEYFSTKYWFDASKWGDDQIDPAFFLHDNDGNVVPRYNTEPDGTRVQVGEYLDLANPAYRDWAVGVITRWMAKAPYRGIAFDAADPIGDFSEPDVNKWANLLGPERVAAYNDGIRDLLTRVRAALGSAHRTIFNGISPSDIRGPDRDLNMLQLADGAMDERFCLRPDGTTPDVRDDIELMMTHRDSTLLMKTNYGTDTKGDTRLRLSRFCLGAFLLGWQPGSTYFEFAPGYGDGQLAREPPNQTVDVGTPKGDVSFSGDIGTRDFTRGYVVVNLGDTDVTVTLPRALSDASTGHDIARAAAGTTVTVPAHDARLYVDATFTPSTHGR